MKIYHLIYVSKSIAQMSRVGLKEILKVAHQNNPKQGITGILVYDRGHFFQVLEGEYNDVESVFARIQKDKRHCRVNRIISYTIQDRLFENWNMGLYHLDETAELDFHKLKKCMKLLQDVISISEKQTLAKSALKIFIDLKENVATQPEILFVSSCMA